MQELHAERKAYAAAFRWGDSDGDPWLSRQLLGVNPDVYKVPYQQLQHIRRGAASDSPSLLFPLSRSQSGGDISMYKIASPVQKRHVAFLCRSVCGAIADV